MKHVVILIPKGEVILSSIVGPFKVLSAANRFMKQMGRQPAFRIQLAGLTRETVLYDGLFSIHPEVLLADVNKPDLIIIPATEPRTLGQNMEFVPWLVRQREQGAEIASLCVGAFLLAATGMMNGKKCTTHWMAADAFRNLYPDVDLLAEKIITDEQGIYTSGGSYSFLNLLLYIVEKYCGRDVSLFLAKVFEIEVERESQSPFIIFQGQKGHEDEPIKKAQEYMESNLDQKISVDQLAGLFLLSKRNFERRFKKATSNTPVEYLQRVKVEAAKKSLESGISNINEVMYAVGITTAKRSAPRLRK